MIITLEKGWRVEGADGVNWQLVGPSRREPVAGPHWQLWEALQEAQDRGINTACPVQADTPTVQAIVRAALQRSIPKELPIDVAIGIGPRHVITLFRAAAAERRWAARYQPADHAPRLLFIGGLETAAIVCCWDHVARSGTTVELGALPYAADRWCSALMRQVRIGKAAYGLNGSVSGIFAKGAA